MLRFLNLGSSPYISSFFCRKVFSTFIHHFKKVELVLIDVTKGEFACTPVFSSSTYLTVHFCIVLFDIAGLSGSGMHFATRTALIASKQLYLVLSIETKRQH